MDRVLTLSPENISEGAATKIEFENPSAEGDFRLVKESPEEIMALIEAQKPKLDIAQMVQIGIDDFFDKLWRSKLQSYRKETPSGEVEFGTTIRET
jgi:hypothetical protein